MSTKNEIPDFSIERFRMGDQAEFERVHHLLHQQLENFAYKLVLNSAEAQDIANDTFVKLWQIHNEFESLSHIQAFLYVVARNACMDYLRFLRKRREILKGILYQKENERDVQNDRISVEMLNILSQRIKTLPDKCRQVFELIYIDNLKTAEVAARMGVCNQTVLNHKAKAIAMLRASLLNTGL